MLLSTDFVDKMEGETSLWHLYILRCCDGSYYTGITNDLDRRLLMHEKGKGSKYVASRLPFELTFTENHESKSAALKRELQIKKLSHKQKSCLVNIE